MEQKLEEVKKEDNQQAKEYFDFIKESVADGSYFKDALNWYFFRYVTPICDRTLLIFGAVIAAVVLYFLTQMIQSAFPLVVKDPVFIKAKDQTASFPDIIPLKPKEGKSGYDPTVKTVDEAVLKYLLSVYIANREAYDFSRAKIEDVNEKFNRVRNTSSEAEYRNFQLVMSKENPDSPIHNFGQNVTKTITVESVVFQKKDPKTFTEKALAYLSSNVPREAEVRFVATTTAINSYNETKHDRQRYLVRMNFDFGGVEKDSKSKVLKFIVNNYQLYKIR